MHACLQQRQQPTEMDNGHWSAVIDNFNTSVWRRALALAASCLSCSNLSCGRHDSVTLSLWDLTACCSRVKGRVMLRASVRLRALATSLVIFFISPPARIFRVFYARRCLFRNRRTGRYRAWKKAKLMAAEYDKERECTELSDKAAMPAILLLLWRFV